MAAVVRLAGVRSGRSELGELREQTVKTLIRAVLVIAIAGSWPSAVLLPAGHVQPLLLVSGLLLTAGLTHTALRRGPQWATTAMIVGLVATLTGVLYLYPDAALASYLCLIVLVAAGTGEWRFAAAAAVLSTFGLVAASVHAANALWPVGTVHALSLIWAALCLTVISSRQLQRVVEWAWNSYLLAQEKVDEARDRQAELGQLSKSLNEACDRLERLNHELIQARAAAEEARRLKAEFAATVGHELRTPVNLIIGFSELMANADSAGSYAEPLPECYRHDLEVICRNAQHISQLVDDILDLSQVDAHRMALRKEPITLAEVVRQAVDSVKALYVREGLSLSSHLPADLPLVTADPLRIRQVLINLFYNALRFTNRGGVTVTARNDSREVTVAVSDTGIGIPPEELPRLFDEFRQAQPAARGRHGSGLGLAVCRRFIELHGGSIWATSKPGTGSTFYFTLPLHGNVVSTAPRPRPLPPVAGNTRWRRIAVLDDTGDAARLLQRYLDDYEIVAVDPQTRPIDLADGERVHAVLTTTASSHRAWKRLAQASPDLAYLPTIVCPLRTRAALAGTLGVAEYLNKPISRNELARALRRLNKTVRRIVIIEDDNDMRALLVRLLRSLSRHYQVSAAADGAAGLELVRAKQPDLVLLDLLMAGTDGWQVIDALHADESLRRIPVIVITAKGLQEGIVASGLVIRRNGGLSVGETISCLKASLDALCSHATGTGLARPAGLPE